MHIRANYMCFRAQERDYGTVNTRNRTLYKASDSGL